MLYQFLTGGLMVAGMYLFLTFSIFLKAGANFIALAILAVAIASVIFRNSWGKFEKENPYPPNPYRFIDTVFKLFGLFTIVAFVVLVVGTLVTGNFALTMKFTALLECLFLLECTLLSAQL